MAPTPSGNGYWLLTARGQVTSFGKAPALGDFPDADEAYAFFVPTPSGRGLWGLTEDGHVVRLGDARDFGPLHEGDDGIDPTCCTGLLAAPSRQGLWGLKKDWNVSGSLRREIFTMPADGSPSPINRTNNEDNDVRTQPAWSPDGTEIVFSSSRDGNWEIYRLTLVLAAGLDDRRLA